jgi:hypothetical protein
VVFLDLPFWEVVFKPTVISCVPSEARPAPVETVAPSPIPFARGRRAQPHRDDVLKKKVRMMLAAKGGSDTLDAEPKTRIKSLQTGRLLARQRPAQRKQTRLVHLA